MKRMRKIKKERKKNLKRQPENKANGDPEVKFSIMENKA